MQAEIVGAASSKVHPGDTDAAGSNVDTSSWEEWDVCQSLFDNNISSSLDANLRYMYKNYGFFLPDVEYLQDPDGLIKCAPAAARPCTPLLSLADLSQPTAASLWDEHTPRRPTRQLLRLTPLSPRTLLTVTRATAPHLDPTLHANLSADIHTAGHARSIPAATHGEHITPAALLHLGYSQRTVSCQAQSAAVGPQAGAHRGPAMTCSVCRYLGAKLRYGHQPLYSSGLDEGAKRFGSLHAVQRHMIDSNRCTMCYDGNEDEYEDYYEYPCAPLPPAPPPCRRFRIRGIPARKRELLQSLPRRCRGAARPSLPPSSAVGGTVGGWTPCRRTSSSPSRCRPRCGGGRASRRLHHGRLTLDHLISQLQRQPGTRTRRGGRCRQLVLSEAS